MKYAYLILITFLGCSSQKDNSDLFSSGHSQGTVDKELEEASGLVASIANPSNYWTLNDSGNGAQIFLINDKAETVLTCTLAGINNRDWEDIAISKEIAEEKNYVYVGEIGDNNARYPYKIIYRFAEPKVNPDFIGIDNLVITQFDTLVFKLSDGIRDTEALMIDPISNEFYIVSKREDAVHLYQLSNHFNSGDTLVAEFKTELPYSYIVAADISSDGKEVLMKDYDHIYYWKKIGQESIPELLKKAPFTLTYEREPQGESIAWQRDGSGFYTLSETLKDFRGKLIYYKRK